LAINRRHLLQSAAFATLAPVLGIAAGVPALAQAQSATEPVWRHALSLFGDIKYPADFKRFDYVNPDAPKGGIARMISIGTFDNFNIAVAGVKGSLAPAAALINETLMTKSQDEVVTEYGLLAEAASHPDDFGWVIYRLRKEARWHDGKPVTPDDVIFSIEVLKKYSPMYASYYRHVVKTEKTGERDIKFTFDATGNRELPTIVGELPVLPKHYWEGTTARAASATSRQRRWRSRSAPARTASRISPPAARSRWNRSGITGAKSCRSGSARTISTKCASSFSGTMSWRWKPSRPTSRLDRGEFGQAMGDGLIFRP
jgi:microcin C transport system substrate-binding protein